MGRVAMEHPGGHSVSVDEADVNNPDANPFNKEQHHVDWNDVNQTVHERVTPARDPIDWIGLEDEGFVIRADIAEVDMVNPVTHQIDVYAGGEIPR